MKSVQLVSMKLSINPIHAALIAASLLSCPAAFSQPVTRLEVIQRENGLVLCESRTGAPVALLRIDGKLQCVEIALINFGDLPVDEWLSGSQLMRRDH